MVFGDIARPSDSPLGAIGSAIVALWALTGVARFFVGVFYDLFLHPLAKFPGPKLASCSNIPYSRWFFSGRQPYKLLELHKKYGPVVRTAPNELSFNTAQSWRDIYGFRPGHKTFIKSDFYSGGSFAGRGVGSIVSERDVDEHALMRKYLSHAFSDRSLSEQEDLIADTIDKFVRLAGERGGVSASAKGWDIGKGFEMMTFDIITDLAFGEKLGTVEDEKPHPWIDIAMGALTQGALADLFKRFPGLASLLTPIFKTQIAKLTEDTRTNEDAAIELVKRRIARQGTDNDRRDFMTRILEQRDPKRVSDLQLAAHASDFVLAGSETTATAMATITYYLLRPENVTARRRLEREIRGAFTRYEDIDARATLPLKYLQLVILEGCRLYPPLPLGLPRVVPEGGDTVDGHALPEGVVVSTNPLAASLDPANFSEPEAFSPERWAPGGVEKFGDVADAAQPFSLGPRGCLGRNLAWMELRTTLAKMFWKYDLQLADEKLDWHRDSEMHTLWKKPKLMVHVRERSFARRA